MTRWRTPTPGAATPRRGRVALLEAMAREGLVVPATVEGLGEPAWVAAESLPALERLRGGAAPERTTLLTPFDSLIWDRARARALFGYEVCFEAYVVPEKRRYGYYCLAILHRGRLVGRLDPKMDRKERRLTVRALYLEPGSARGRRTAGRRSPAPCAISPPSSAPQPSPWSGRSQRRALTGLRKRV